MTHVRHSLDNQDQLWRILYRHITEWCLENDADPADVRKAANYALQNWVQRVTDNPNCQRDTALGHAQREAIEKYWG